MGSAAKPGWSIKKVGSIKNKNNVYATSLVARIRKPLTPHSCYTLLILLRTTVASRYNATQFNAHHTGVVYRPREL